MRLVLWSAPGKHRAQPTPWSEIPADDADAQTLCDFLDRVGTEFARQLGERTVQAPLPKVFLVANDHPDPTKATIVWWDLAEYCHHGSFHPYWVRNDLKYRWDNGRTIMGYEASLRPD